MQKVEHVLTGRGLVALQLQLKVGSWLLLVPPRRLVNIIGAEGPPYTDRRGRVCVLYQI